MTEITFHWEISILIRLGLLVNYSNSLVQVAGSLFLRLVGKNKRSLQFSLPRSHKTVVDCLVCFLEKANSTEAFSKIGAKSYKREFPRLVKSKADNSFFWYCSNIIAISDQALQTTTRFEQECDSKRQLNFLSFPES